MPRARWLLLGLTFAALAALLIAGVNAGDPIGGVGHGMISRLL